MLPCYLSHFKAKLSNSWKQGHPSATESAWVHLTMSVIKIAKVRQKWAFQQPPGYTSYSPERPESQRLLTTASAKHTHHAWLVPHSAVHWPHQPSCCSRATPTWSLCPGRSANWNSLLKKILTKSKIFLKIKKKKLLFFFLQVLEKTFVSHVLLEPPPPSQPPWYCLTLLESRDCVISFCPAIILVISWFTPSWDACYMWQWKYVECMRV